VEDKYRVVDELMGKLTIEQKVGQLFTQAFYGSLIVPDTIRTIRDLNCGGLRITQHFRGFRRYARAGEKQEAFDKLSPGEIRPNLLDDRKDLLCKSPYLTINQYARLLDDLKRIAEDRPYHIPLHMMLDQEGGGSFDCARGGMRYFPSQFGYARCGDADLVYRVAKAVATQLSAVGFNIINSPCVDIVLNPSATYIRTRAFGCEVEHVCEMASAALRGYTDGGLIASPKHFPGRGATDVDAHHDVAIIDRPFEVMWAEDLAPYHRMIKEGLKAIMIAHTIYPAFDAEHISSVSEGVITDLLREKMGFTGMICTDSMIMGAIAKKYGIPGGCVRAIKAGASAILMKECGPIREEAHRLTVEAVKNGDISEDHIDELVIRNIKAKVDAGLFGEAYRRDPDQAESVVRSEELGQVEADAAAEAVHLVRDSAGALPLSTDTRTMLVEQIPTPHVNINDATVHPGILWEFMNAHGENVSLLEVEVNPTEEDAAKLDAYLEFYDCVVLTYYKDRTTVGSADLIEKCLAAGKTVIVVAQNPLPYELPETWPTVIASYGVMPPVLKLSADLIYGKFTPKTSPNPKPWEA